MTVNGASQKAPKQGVWFNDKLLVNHKQKKIICLFLCHDLVPLEQHQELFQK